MTPPVGRELLEWDTRFWGFRVARIGEESLEPAAMEEVVRWCDDQDVRCTYLLVDAADAASLERAQDHGFRFVDTRIELRRAPPPIVEGESIGAAVRPARAADLPELERIAAASFTSTRFFADPNFDRDRARDLYVSWVHRRMEGAGNLVMVAESGGGPVGFLAGCADAAGGEARHELVAVDSRHRGGGVAKKLISGFSERLAGRGAEVETTATQAGNLAGLSLWVSVGFRIVKIGHWLHRWHH